MKVLYIALIGFILAGCGPSTDQLTATVQAAEAMTRTAAPTNTPTQTLTPKSTPTSIPEPTATPASSPIPPTFTPEPISTASTANSITSIKIYLPERYKWNQITNKSDGNQYIREWVPEGSTGSDTKWIIVEQKFVLDSPISAEEFITTIFALARNACSDILYNGPEKIDVNGHETYVGRFMCAEQKGMGYGTFTDQRVIVQGSEVYVITSELHIPSSPKAGILSFQKDQEVQTFMDMQELSANFVRDSIRVCTTETVDC